MRIRLRIRRLFCDFAQCPRKIFAERLPDLAAPYARRTRRLADAIELIGFVLGGEAGARTAAKLGIHTSPDTLIRAVRRAPLPEITTPRVLGIDDWAIRRGHSYGTILIDLEHHRRVDVLPDRKAETLTSWLQSHQGVEIISRDRAGAYAEGARIGAPNAVQVIDRWHLLKNLGEAMERFLATRHEALRAVGKILTEEARRQALSAVAEASALTHTQASADQTLPPGSWRARVEENQQARRSRRLSRYQRVIELFNAGWTKRAIAREMHLDIKTVRKYVGAGSFPDQSPRCARWRALDAHRQYLEERWIGGCRNATQLWREIQQRGYRQGVGSVRRLIHTWRQGDGRGKWKKDAAQGEKPTVKVKAPSPRRAMWLLMRDVADLDGEDRARRDKVLELCPDAEAASQIAGEFQEIIRERKVEALGGWLQRAKASKVGALVNFAAGLESDRKELEAALRLEWSNGQTEGQVNRIKAIKRAMYGRAKFDLLRRKILLAG